MNTEPRVIAHLVHGTWPSGGFVRHKYGRLFKLVHGAWPRSGFLHKYRRLFEPLPVWSEKESDFCHALESKIPGIEWRPFQWSGENSELDRRKAAIEFAEVLRQETKASSACHLIIAHSHGGNVALWGLGQLSQDEQSRISGLATLATPFLSFLPRQLNDNEASYLKAIRDGSFLWFCLFTQLLMIPYILFTNSTDLTFGEKLVVIPILIFGAVGLLKVMKLQRHALRWLHDNPPRSPPALVSFIALRAPADEAARAIAVADAGARIVGLFWILVRWYARLTPWAAPGRQLQTLRKLSRRVIPWLVPLFLLSLLWLAQAPKESYRELGFGEVGFAVVAAAWFALLFGGLYGSVFIVWFYGIMLANAVEAYTRVLLTAGFGSDAALLSIATEITAEHLPMMPKANLEMLAVTGDSQMRHSLHSMPVARERLIQWVLERRQAACDPV